MLKYHYRCEFCLHEHSVRHSIKEKRENCKECDSIGTLIRIPSFSFVIKKGEVGKVVKEYIEDAKRDIHYDKEEMQKDYDI